MRENKVNITQELIDSTPGVENSKRIISSWISQDSEAVYQPGSEQILITSPGLGPIGLLDLQTGEFASDTPEQGQRQSVIDEATLSFARALCGLLNN